MKTPDDSKTRRLPGAHCRSYAVLVLLVLSAVVSADEWNTGYGRDESRAGLSPAVGPLVPEVLWEGSLGAFISESPVIGDGKVFIARMTVTTDKFAGATIVAHDLINGEVVWSRILPALPGEVAGTDYWHNHVLAFRDGHVYATRSGQGRRDPLYALDPADGSIIWTSDDEVTTPHTESPAFMANGDIIVRGLDYVTLLRLNKDNGDTMWSTPTNLIGDGAGGVAVFGNTGYLWERLPGAIDVVAAYDMVTGARKYDCSPVITWSALGLAQQSGVFLGPDGTVYGPRSRQTIGALEDTGTGFTLKWTAVMGGAGFSTYGVGPDGSIYSMTPPSPDLSQDVIRLNPLNGSIVNISSVPVSDVITIRMAIDADGKVYVSNGAHDIPNPPNNWIGRVWCFTPDLQLIWTDEVFGIGHGGPALGGKGILVVAGKDDVVRAYRNPRGDMNCDGSVGLEDIGPFVTAVLDPAAYEVAFRTCDPNQADMNADTFVNGLDIQPFAERVIASSQSIVYLTQSRSVGAEAEAGSAFDTDSDSAADFGPYDASVTAFADSGASNTTASASQTSTLDSASFSVDTQIDATVSASGGEGATGFADTDFVITFELPNTEPIDLTGSASAFGDDASTTVRLVGPGGVLLDTGPIVENTVPISFSATLSAGEYTLTAVTSLETFTSAGPTAASGAIDVDFVIAP